jgi:hypothetical protein
MHDTLADLTGPVEPHEQVTVVGLGPQQLFHLQVDPFGEQVGERIRPRPPARIDGEQHYATSDLSRRDEPSSWERLCSDEALERLAASLSLPGIRQARWSDHGWPSRLTVVNSAGAQEQWIALPGVSPDIHDQARQLAADEAQRRWGVTPGDHGVAVDRIPAQDWADLLTSKVAEALVVG